MLSWSMFLSDNYQTFLTFSVDSRPTTAKQLRSMSRPPVPISNATKRSFHANSGPIPGDMQALASNSSPDLRRDSGR